MASSVEKLTLAALAALLFVSLAHGCATSECLRHTDCDAGFECSRGTCIVAVDEESGTGGQSSTSSATSTTTQGNAGAPGE